MSYLPTLNDEIEKVLDRLQTAGEPMMAQWVAHEVCNSHRLGLADVARPTHELTLEEEEGFAMREGDRAFWQYGGYAETRARVGKAINRRAGKPDEVDGKQLKLPGFKHLQAYYVVERNGDKVGVPVDDMTDGEIDAKALELRIMGTSCHAHANELDRFKQLRRPAKTA